jgi:IS1 family transposase
VDWAVDPRGNTTCHQLWTALPAHYRYHCWYHIDEWSAYAAVLSPQAHPRDASGETNTINALNYSLHRCSGLLMSISCLFSNLLKMPHARIKLVID